jgi:UDP-N-acetylmuramate dehydrogenase
MELLSGFEHFVRENEKISSLTRLRIGGNVRYLAEPTSSEELAAITRRFADAGIPIRLIGGGSNLLVSDDGFDGLVIRLTAPAFGDLEVKDDHLIAGGGAQLSNFISVAVREGFSGPEQLVGIPGTVGGALHGNSTNHGADIGSWLVGATVLTRSGEIESRQRSELSFGYRISSLNELAILSAEFQFEKENSSELTKRMQKIWIVQKSQQPLAEENCGYLFNDHGGESASSLIDRAGLKGTHVGNVRLSERNSNFVITEADATCQEVEDLIESVQFQVEERLGIQLETGLTIWK